MPLTIAKVMICCLFKRINFGDDYVEDILDDDRVDISTTKRMTRSQYMVRGSEADGE